MSTADIENVVLLRHGAQASVRVLQDPTPPRVREVIDHIVKQRVDQGQLDAAPLTLRDLDVIKRAFARALQSLRHARLDYPTASGGVTPAFTPA